MNITMVVFTRVLCLEESLLQTLKSSAWRLHLPNLVMLHGTGSANPNGCSATEGCNFGS